MTVTIILSVIASLLAGSLITWIFLNKKITEVKQKSSAYETEIIKKDSEISSLIKRLEEHTDSLNRITVTSKNELKEERDKYLELTSNHTRAIEQNTALAEKLELQKKEIEDIQKKFYTEFENLANKILKQNTSDFTETNEKKISEILNPLKEKLANFEKQINDTYVKGLKDQTDLKAELKKLYELSNTMNIEAQNLTKALKGDVKKQGNWGELVLERILERSGLIKGEEYETQFTARNDHGETIRPDIVVKLPDNKHIIIDSKVSLIAYEQFVNSDLPEEKEKFLRMHIESIKNHIKGLSEKSYAHAEKINSPEFVLMFLPIESSFSLAIQQDVELFNFAWDKRVVLVSPSTLLATLRTVESIWKHEKQTKNAIEIASEGGKLYDKFVGFTEDMKKLGSQLNVVLNTYQEANKKLYEGNGNILSKVEKLRQLGAKSSKSLPANLFKAEDE